MATTRSKVYLFSLLLSLVLAFVLGHSVEGGDTILHLLEGNVTSSPFDNDGTDFDIFNHLLATSTHGHRFEEDIPGYITVLVPDDNAFRRAVGDLGLKTNSELETYENFLIYLMEAYQHPFAFLTRILYYHVIPGELNSTAALEMPSFATWDAPSRITREERTLIDRNPELPNPNFDTDRMDIQASNGVIHVIDYVLFPEVMRKMGLAEVEEECNTPEPTFEDTELDEDIGPSPDDDISNPTMIEQQPLETDEPSPVPSDFSVGPTLPLEPAQSSSPNTGTQVPGPTLPLEPAQSSSPNPGTQVPTITETVSPLQFENAPEEEVIPSKDLIGETPEDAGDSNELLPSSSPLISSDVEVSASPYTSDNTSGTEMPLEDDVQVPTASANPVPFPNPSQEQMESEDSSVPEFPLEQPSLPLNSPTNPDDSLEPEITNVLEAEPSFPVETDVEIPIPSEKIRALSMAPDTDVPSTSATAQPDTPTLPSPFM